MDFFRSMKQTNRMKNLRQADTRFLYRKQLEELQLFKPVAIEDHEGYAQAISGGALVDMEPLGTDFVIVVFTHEYQFVSFDPDVSFTSAAVPDVKDP